MSSESAKEIRIVLTPIRLFESSALKLLIELQWKEFYGFTSIWQIQSASFLTAELRMRF